MSIARVAVKVFAVLTILTSGYSLYQNTQGNSGGFVSMLGTIFAVLTVISFAIVSLSKKKTDSPTK